MCNGFLRWPLRIANPCFHKPARSCWVDGNVFDALQTDLKHNFSRLNINTVLLIFENASSFQIEVFFYVTVFSTSAIMI